MQAKGVASEILRDKKRYHYKQLTQCISEAQHIEDEVNSKKEAEEIDQESYGGPAGTFGRRMTSFEPRICGLPHQQPTTSRWVVAAVPKTAAIS